MHTLTFNSEVIVINQLKHSRYSDLPKLWRANQSSFPMHRWKETDAKCIFRLHPATCTVFFCHLAEQNPPPCRGCLPLHRWCKGSARSLRSGKALASKVQLVNQSS